VLKLCKIIGPVVDEELVVFAPAILLNSRGRFHGLNAGPEDIEGVLSHSDKIPWCHFYPFGLTIDDLKKNHILS
jgi:hypothetical protein